MPICTCYRSTGQSSGRQRQANPDSSWASQPSQYGSSNFSERPCFKKFSGEQQRKTPPSCSGTHTCTLLCMCSLPLLSKESSEEIQDGKEALAQHLLDNSIYCFHLTYFYFALLGTEAGDESQGLLLGKHFITGSVLQPLLMCTRGPSLLACGHGSHISV